MSTNNVRSYKLSTIQQDLYGITVTGVDYSKKSNPTWSKGFEQSNLSGALHYQYIQDLAIVLNRSKQYIKNLDYYYKFIKPKDFDATRRLVLSHLQEAAVVVVDLTNKHLLKNEAVTLLGRLQELLPSLRRNSRYYIAYQKLDLLLTDFINKYSLETTQTTKHEA